MRPAAHQEGGAYLGSLQPDDGEGCRHTQGQLEGVRRRVDDDRRHSGDGNGHTAGDLVGQTRPTRFGRGDVYKRQADMSGRDEVT